MTNGPSGEMPFLEHLEELRYRLLWSVGALAIGMMVGFAVVMQKDLNIIGTLAAPVLPYLPQGKLIITNPVDNFTIPLKVAFALGLVLAAPVIGYHLWRFLSPALHPHEKRLMVPVLAFATGLFASGVYIGWRWVLPLMLDLLFSMQSTAFQQMITASEFFSFLVSTCLAFGAVSQLPVLVLALTALGIVTPRGLAKFRRHAAAGSVIVAAIVTPGDFFLATLLLAGPLYALYEVSIIVSWFTFRAKAKRERIAAAVLLLLALSGTASAQSQPPSRPVPPSQPATGAQAPRSDPNRGAAPRDTTQRPALVEWTPDDSTMRALLARPGYTVVRYQAKEVGFAAEGRTMTLTGTDSLRAAVQRDSTLLVAATIQFSDSTKIIGARGASIVMRDPARGEDILGQTEMTYDVTRREGKTRELSTVANSGEDWRVLAHRAAFSSDSASDRSTVYGRDGIITSCLDSLPHYHFLAKELKRVSKNVIVARPAILYLQDVPVMWLPFVFQDIRTGRRSGILTPRIGFSELVRNSPTYRRTAENLGYYFAFSDYLDAQLSMDWRSSARATMADPGWLRLNAELRYRWLDRFVSGGIALSQNALSSGSRNTTLSWSHNQEFSSRTRFTSNLNYATSTQILRQTMVNPLAVMATIASQLNLVRQQGPLSINLGGARRQYPGRDQVDQDFPSLNIGSKPLALGEWFLVTPSFQATGRQSLDIDATGDFAYRYLNSGGALDSVRLKRNTSATTLSLSTPFKFFGFQVQSGFRFAENVNDFPALRTLVDPADTSRRIERVYDKTFLSSADIDIGIGLPAFFQGTWNVSPSITASNVDPAGYFVRSERTAGRWVGQNKRLSYGLSISPTIFGLFPGFGRVERFRHAIAPTLSYGYSPAATVSEEYLLALGKTSSGYLGSLTQNRVTLGISTNIEARMRSPGDSAAGEGPKVKVLTMQFTPLSYDFERKRVTGKSGFATDRLGYTLRSDLLPGFDLGVDYSLFRGNVLSDTAVFSPFRETVRASFSLTNTSTIVRAVGRLFGAEKVAAAAPGAAAPPTAGLGGGTVSGRGPSQGLGAVTGARTRGAITEIPTGQGFSAGFTLSSSRFRTPVGGRIIEFDAEALCAGQLGLPSYDFCLAEARRKAGLSQDGGPQTDGATFVKVPPQTSVGVRTSFNLTPKWAASWATSYDVERSEFASQVVTLQREMHDWRAVFGFTQAPNGNFAFTFFIALKAQPELKVDYDRQSYRQPNLSNP